jgi:hypothetical protein
MPGMDYAIVSVGDYGVGGMLPEEAKAMGAPPCWTALARSGGHRRSRLAHKFTASVPHCVTPPLPQSARSCRNRPRPVFATRAPGEGAAGCTSRRIQRGCASAQVHWPPGANRPISCFTVHHRRSTKMLLWQRPRPSMLIAIP